MLLTGSAGLKPKFSLKKYVAKLKYKRLKALVKEGKISESVLNNYGSDDYKRLSPVMKKTFVNIVNFYQNDSLKNIKCATLLVWGRQDKETPLAFAKTIKRKVKDCGLVTFEGGHFAYLEHAASFNIIINNFFKD